MRIHDRNAHATLDHRRAADLADGGLDLLVALNGEDGLRIAREGRPDLILLDVQMPSIDGLSLCRWLKAQFSAAQRQSFGGD
ncbi:MAG: response regulator [Sphingobacteriia bacterium]|nr:response regulator [Sphingobacteriia bacterium]NCC38485.1 response regulator [Gammaproteobacteria bacterium]